VLAIAVAATAIMGFAAAASAHHKTGHHHGKPAHHSGGGWTWTKPFALPGKPEVFTLSCASTTLCVATGITSGNPAENDVYASTNPSGGSSAWQPATLQPASDLQLAPGGTQEALDNASCEQAGAAVDCAVSSGWDDLFQTSDPTDGASAWGESMPTLIAFVSLSCWSAWCGELDVNGDAVVTIGAQATSEQQVFNLSEGLSSQPGGISCNASAFCAAVDQSDQIAWTSDATDSPPTWTTAALPSGNDLLQIACPSTALCIALETSHSGKPEIGVSTDPAAGVSTWKSFALPVGSVSCQSASFCVASGAKSLYTSSDPGSASAGAWKKSKMPLSADVVSCPTATECVAADGGDITVGKR
jgi:hypothetical protein